MKGLENETQAQTFSILKYLLPYFKKHYVAICFLVILLLSDTAAILTLSYAYKILFSYIASTNSHYIIASIIIKLFIVFIIIFLGLIGADYLIVYLTKKIMQQTRIALFWQINLLQYSMIIQISNGELLNYFSIDLTQIERSLTVNFPGIIRRGFVIIFILSLLFYIEWKLALIALIAIPLTLIIVHYFNQAAMRAQHNKKDLDASLLTLLNENINLNSFIRIYNLIDYNYQRYNLLLNPLLISQNIYNKNSLRVATTVKISFFLILLIAISYSIFLVLDNYLSLGGFMAVISLYSALIAAIIETIQHLVEISNASLSMRKITQFLTLPGRINYKSGSEIENFKDQINVNNVSFSYNNNSNVLENICFTIPAKASVGIAGHSGSGKSTLLSLFLNLYQPTTGDILIDSINLKDINLSSYYQYIAVINQEPPLLNATIFENILIGNLTSTENDVINAAKTVGLHDFILSLPDGYQTKIDMIANKLSGGQKQRIAIARALVRKAQILFLDEITTGLDSQSRHQILQLIESFYGKKTIIHISHRLADFEKMDNVIVIDKGKLVQTGKHQELIQVDGVYKKLWDIEHAFDVKNEGEHIEIKTHYLSQISLFSHLNNQHLMKIANLFMVYKAAENTVVTKEGEIGDKFYIIVSGLVSVYKTINGQITEISTLQNGDYFGEIALIQNIPRTATVVTKTPTLFVTLNQVLFQKLLAENREILNIINQSIEQRTR